MDNIDIRKLKKQFFDIVEKNVKREGVLELCKKLEGTDFFTAPASRMNHGSFEGGLLAHSLAVWDELYYETRLLFMTEGKKQVPDDIMESITIMALFHDLCKTNYYGVSQRNTKDEKGKWIQVPYYTIDDKFPFGHGDKSVVMLMDAGIRLTTTEMLAIKHHMGGYAPKEDWSSSSKAYSENALILLLHIADMKATYIRKI